MKRRLDQTLAAQEGLTRSQAESYIRLGKVTVDGKVVTKTGFEVNPEARVKLTAKEMYVSRAGLKLTSVAQTFGLDFRDKIVLDVGSSTGGFTDYALQHGAKKVFAAEVGRDQLHPSLHNNPKIELHEQTDIRDFTPSDSVDIVVADVSFVSLRELIPHIVTLCASDTQLVLMVKPQFEAVANKLKHKGVIKNEKVRRQILSDFEAWSKKFLVILDKADSQVIGAQGNRERFYLAKRLP